MATPRLALRFRDTSPNVDTIEEHRKIIESEGSVLWGWWKKDFEPEFEQLFLSLKKSGHVFILDRSVKKCYQAKFIRAFKNNIDNLDKNRIPSYYRGESEKVNSWFLLTEIESKDYDENLGKQIGDSTLLILDHSDSPDTSADKTDISKFIKISNKNSLLHLSDLHFGADHGFFSADFPTLESGDTKCLTNCIINDLKRLNKLEDIEYILLTGDITTQGDWSDRTRNYITKEITLLSNELGVKKENIIAIPGNHDVIRYKDGISSEQLLRNDQVTYEHEHSYRIFIEELTGKHWKEPLNFNMTLTFKSADVHLSALNSCKIVSTQWTEYGYVGDSGIDLLDNLALLDIVRPTYKLMALHHHLLPVSRVEVPNSKGVSLTLDAIDLLDKAAEVGVDIAIHGHQHLSRISKYQKLPFKDELESQPLIIISGGSGGVNNKRRVDSMRNSYSVLSFEENTVNLHMREICTDGKVAHTLYDDKLPVNVTLPENMPFNN